MRLVKLEGAAGENRKFMWSLVTSDSNWVSKEKTQKEINCI
jgi:hypothetical protein